ncbi:MAG: XRE family transcriptional regulator [Geminicoccaceae bacterium]
MSDELELVRGSDNPFRDVDIPDSDTELMKADLASGIVRIMREQNMSATDAARAAEVAVADISRIRKAALDRFTIDRLVKIHNRLDRGTRIRVDFSHAHDGARSGATHP